MKLSEIRKLTEAFSNMAENTPDLLSAMATAEKLGIQLDQVYQEMEMDDPYVNTHEDPGIYPGAVHLHSHGFYEVLYICSGNIQYLIGTDRYRLQPGDVILVPPGVSHRPLLTEGQSETYRRYVLWLSNEFVQMIASFFPREGFLCPSLLRTAGTKRNQISRRFQTGIRETSNQKPGWKAALYANTIELMVEFYRIVMDTNTQHPLSEEPQLLDQILNYVEENLSNRISLSETARKFYVSESTISTIFRKEMGISFYRSVTQRRLIASKNLIVSGEPLENVAGKVGFSDYSAFYRAFKQEYGISPRQFREQQTK